MKVPQRTRSQRRSIRGPGAGNLAEIAGRARYVGSPEHKDSPSFAGHSRPRADASLCDRRLSQDLEQVTRWLKTAIELGAVGGIQEGDFPRYAWYKHEGVVYEARLVNRELGEYKGYPLNETEWPEGLDVLYD